MSSKFSPTPSEARERLQNLLTEMYDRGIPLVSASLAAVFARWDVLSNARTRLDRAWDTVDHAVSDLTRLVQR
jgi:hypothetical protein